MQDVSLSEQLVKRDAGLQIPKYNAWTFQSLSSESEMNTSGQPRLQLTDGGAHFVLGQECIVNEAQQ